MKPIGENEKGEVIYNELHCDVCEQMSGPRSRFDNCLNCNATRTQRLRESHKQFTFMVLNNAKRELEFRAECHRKKFPELIIDVKVEINIS